ncbi:hypothetical protein LIER_39366 [Lithospermum erythrorhizon]|uniref:Reverse transcriptase zinc-binding domain-containing protein n=1 Tax=Lithospermum erythrorhizon TaxID=34254 RepID=A0AAV3QFD0_LITER
MPLLSEKDDKMCWFGSRTIETTRVYSERFESPDVVSWWKIMWFNRNMLRCDFITWIVCLRKLPTKDRALLGWQGGQEWLLRKGCGKSFRRRLQRLVANYAIYVIWRERNSIIFMEQRRGIANVVAHRIQMVQGKVVSWKDWGFDLHIVKE